MTTPTTPAAAVSLRFRKKPVVIEASQWFKNGDHPLDYSRTHQGLENGQLRDFQPQERQANAWEGDIVRYYRTPSIDGQYACKNCGKIMHEHGWIDTLEGGHIVCPGDWIITGVAGEHYPCKPDIFAKTYEPAELASVQNASLVEKLAKRTCEANADSARFTIALQTLRASLDPDDWMGPITMHSYIDTVLAGGSPLQQHPAPSPAQQGEGAINACITYVVHGDADFSGLHQGLASYFREKIDALRKTEPAAQAVDAEDERIDALKQVDRFFVERLAELGCLSPEAGTVHAMVRAALQASRQPVTQQAVAEGAGDGLRQTLIDVGRVIAWQCFGDCRAYDEFGPGSLRGLHEMDAEIRAALATKEPK